MNVRTDPTRYIGQDADLTIFPLLSWYHASWDTEPDLPEGIGNHAAISDTTNKPVDAFLDMLSVSIFTVARRTLPLITADMHCCYCVAVLHIFIRCCNRATAQEWRLLA